MYDLDGLIDLDDIKYNNSDIQKFICVYLKHYLDLLSDKEFISFDTSDDIYHLTGISHISFYMSNPDIIDVYGNSDILYYYNEICKLNYNVFHESYNFHVKGLGVHKNFIKSGYLSNLVFKEEMGEREASKIYPPVFEDLSVYFNDLISLDTTLYYNQLKNLCDVLYTNNLYLNSGLKIELYLNDLPNFLDYLDKVSKRVNGFIDINLYSLYDLSDSLLSFISNHVNIRFYFYPCLKSHYSNGESVYLKGRKIGHLDGAYLILNDNIGV